MQTPRPTRAGSTYKSHIVMFMLSNQYSQLPLETIVIITISPNEETETQRNNGFTVDTAIDVMAWMSEHLWIHVFAPAYLQMFGIGM